MARKATKTILAALKKAGVEIADQVKVEEALEDIELQADEFVGQDQILLSMADYRELKDDLKGLRARAKTAEAKVTELEEAQDAGDSTTKRKADRLQERVSELEPLVEKLLGSQTAVWDAAVATIPEKLKTKFKFAEKDKPLTADEVLQNVGKLSEYRELGLIGESKTEPAAPPAAPAAPNAPPRIPSRTETKLTPEQLNAMTPTAKIESGYANMPGSSTP